MAGKRTADVESMYASPADQTVISGWGQCAEDASLERVIASSGHERKSCLLAPEIVPGKWKMMDGCWVDRTWENSAWYIDIIACSL
jgi:hypothetical protein